MHLKSLTLKGFKSFASATTFAFEPGVTCIVGPNGSGKSNVVDALAWVMGEQGAKTLRGGKMEDVIFAGTATRGPLGRAEVQLTIDNSDGALAIEYSEVTISRTLFRNGSSEYAINGQSARLLDVQELLSDSGLGREMHVIVGQGRLDRVLQASPEERRGFIEEAAGILKHRRRKEKTIRKLDAMESNLTRLSDLAGELRRQLKPLGRQAEVARAAESIAAEVRDAKARLMADELARLSEEQSALSASEQDRVAERMLLQEKIEQLRANINQIDMRSLHQKVDDSRSVAFELERAGERIRNLNSLVIQRLTFLASQENSTLIDSTVDESELQLQEEEIARLEQSLLAAENSSEDHGEVLTSIRQELDVVDEHISQQSALITDHDLKVQQARGSFAATQSRFQALEASLQRQAEALQAAQQRLSVSESSLAQFKEQEEPVQTERLSAAYEAAQKQSLDREAQLGQIREDLHKFERESGALAAQIQALGRALEIRNGAAALVEEKTPGVLGLVSDKLNVEAGFETAITAALGAVADGLLVESGAYLNELLPKIQSGDYGSVDILIADAAPHAAPQSKALPHKLRPAAALLNASPGVQALLVKVFVFSGADAEVPQLFAEHPELADAVIVTLSGARFTRASVRLGSGSSPSRLALVAERDAALKAQSFAQDSVSELRAKRDSLTTLLNEDRESARQALQSLRAYDAALAEFSENRNRALVQHESAKAECDRLDDGISRAEEELAAAEQKVQQAENELKQQEAQPRPIIDVRLRDELAEKLDAARNAQLQSMVAIEGIRERLRSAKQRLEVMSRTRQRELAALAQAQRRAAERAVAQAETDAIAQKLPVLLDSVEQSILESKLALSEAERERNQANSRLSQLRSEEGQLNTKLQTITDSVHGLELRMHENRLHLDNLRNRALSELGLSDEVLLAEYAPVKNHEESPDAAVEPFDRAKTQRALAEAERKLSQLGRINPLALEEFAALEQRHAFLVEQLDDLSRTRADLVTIIEQLDEKMEEIFTEAFLDTQRAFAEVFPILFPGGEGSISLENPAEPLTSGIRVSVRPAGKKVERLSLLSGGERSLAAVALLVAIFIARPSPFYILDEVEAALDDANLGRLLSVFEKLRESSQLLVITHQKRTMEIADVLYGVSMRQDGVSAVVGQRVGDAALA